MAELRPFKTYTGVQKTKRLSSKSGRGTRTPRLHKREISSLSADKINYFYCTTGRFHVTSRVRR